MPARRAARPALRLGRLATFAAAALLAAGCPSDPPADRDGGGADSANPIDATPPADAWRCVATGGSAPFRLATWNVHDLYDEVDRTQSPGEEDEVYSAAQVQAKLADVGDVLRAIDADVVLLQEVENLALLERLLDGPLAGEGYVEARLIDAFDPRGIDVGAISKLPIDLYLSHIGERDPNGAYLWSRDAVEVHVTVGGRPVVFLNNHFISQVGGNDQRRTYQAEGAREIVDELAEDLPDALVGVGGDLNDSPESAPLAPLLGDGAWEDLGARLSASQAWTYDGGSRLDYLLVHSRSSSWATGVRVETHPDISTSDHRPVVADFQVPGCAR